MIRVKNKFIFEGMPKCASTSSASMLINLFDQSRNEGFVRVPHHVTKIDFCSSPYSTEPFITSARVLDEWLVSFYNFAFHQNRDDSSLFTEILGGDTSFESFKGFALNKTGKELFVEDMGVTSTSPNSMSVFREVEKDYWDFDGNLYEYLVHKTSGGRKPDYVIDTSNWVEDWVHTLNDIGIMPKYGEAVIRNHPRNNVGNYRSMENFKAHQNKVASA